MTRPGPKSEPQKQYMSIVGNQEPPVTLYLHCKRAYDHMLSQAKRVVADADIKNVDGQIEIGDVNTMIVWEGMLTRLITGDLNLSVPYYSSITKSLKNMGCIRQLRRGGGNSPSQWELITEPTEEMFNSITPKKETKPNKHEMLQDQVAHLNSRVLVLEERVQALLKAAS